MDPTNGIILSALSMIWSLDAGLVAIVSLSLRVTLSAVVIACVIGLPLGALAGAAVFPGRGVLRLLLNALMALPPVVVGLTVYLMLSASGPLGPLRLLYTPTAMIIAQVILVTPIVAALTSQVVEDLHREYSETFRSLGVGVWTRIGALLWDARLAVLTVALAGFGRAMAEVGAVLIVGGNIHHVTRVMTTTIALETSRGNLELALALGVVLLLLALLINAAVMSLRSAAQQVAHA